MGMDMDAKVEPLTDSQFYALNIMLKKNRATRGEIAAAAGRFGAKVRMLTPEEVRRLERYVNRQPKEIKNVDSGN